MTKKTAPGKKLSLKKKALLTLSSEEMSGVHGGTLAYQGNLVMDGNQGYVAPTPTLSCAPDICRPTIKYTGG